MRKLLYFSLVGILFSISSIPCGAFGASLHALRGFEVGKSYEHAAIRRCGKWNVQFECILEVFSATNAILSFKLKPAQDALTSNRSTVDYGIFTFRVLSDDQKTSPEVKLQNIKRVPLGKWLSLPQENGLAKLHK